MVEKKDEFTVDVDLERFKRTLTTELGRRCVAKIVSNTLNEDYERVLENMEYRDTGLPDQGNIGNFVAVIDGLPIAIHVNFNNEPPQGLKD